MVSTVAGSQAHIVPKGAYRAKLCPLGRHAPDLHTGMHIHKMIRDCQEYLVVAINLATGKELAPFAGNMLCHRHC